MTEVTNIFSEILNLIQVVYFISVAGLVLSVLNLILISEMKLKRKPSEHTSAAPDIPDGGIRLEGGSETQ